LLLAELLRCSDRFQQIALLEAARATPPAGHSGSRRDAAKDLLRSKSVAKFVEEVMPSFTLTDAGLVCVRPRNAAAAAGAAAAAAAAAVGASHRLLIPRELIAFVASTAAVTLHAERSSTGLRYDGQVAIDAVFRMIKDAGYWAGDHQLGCLSLSCVNDVLLTKLFHRPATGWTGSNDTGGAGVWLPRTLSLFDESYTAAHGDQRLSLWLDTIPAGWSSFSADFPKLRSFQVSAGPEAIVLPKSELAGRDSILKALGVNAGSSTVTKNIYYSAGYLCWRYECVRSGDPEVLAQKAAQAAGAQKAAKAKANISGTATDAAFDNPTTTTGAAASSASADAPAAAFAEHVRDASAAAADSLQILDELGAVPDNAEARAIIAGMKAVAERPRPASRASAVGADTKAGNEPSSSIACKCQQRTWVYWPIVGRLAILVTSGGHSGHTLRSADDKRHLGLPPIVEELLIDAGNNPGGMTVNLTQRATVAGKRQLIHRERAAVRRLHGWARELTPLQGLTANSTHMSPPRPRGKYGHLHAQADLSGVVSAMSVVADGVRAEADLSRCGLCQLATTSDSDVEHCSQCFSAYHLKCAHQYANAESATNGATVATSATGARASDWVCHQCQSQNAADDAAAERDLQPAGGRAAGWLPPPSGVVCPGTLLTQPQADYLACVFKLGPMGRLGQPTAAAVEPGLVLAPSQPQSTVSGVVESKCQDSEDDDAMPALAPLLPRAVPSPWDFAASHTDLPYSIACYTMPTDASVVGLLKSLRRFHRGGSSTADDTLRTVQRLSDEGWATVRRTSSRAPVDSALTNLCVFIMSDDMRAFVRAEKAHSTLNLRIRICDATFSIGNHDLQLFGVLAIDAETGIAVPVAWFIVGKPVDTDAIEWCFEQCADAGIPPAFITMFDKDSKEFNATARVAARRWHSEAGNASRSTALEALTPLAAAADQQLVSLASAVLERTPGGTEYSSRVLPPKPSELAGFAALGSLTADQASAVQLVFKPELLGYGRVLLGLARIMLDRISSRIVPAEPMADYAYDDWHGSMRPMLPFTHFVRLDGPIRSFLDDYCLIFALLCIFHVRQALTRNILPKRGTATAAQRKQIVDEFITFVENAPAVGWEPLFDAYKAKWEGIVDASWWVYLRTEWLAEKWRTLLLSSERDVFARLYIETTNGIELVWRIFKYDWLLHKRVATYATAFRLLFGLPWETNSAFLSMTGRVLFTLVQVRSGLARPPLRRRVQAMVDRMTPLLLRADADDRFLRSDAENPCWYSINATSCQFASARSSLPPLLDAKAGDYPSLITVVTEARRRQERGCHDPSAVSATVSRLRSIASGAAAAQIISDARRGGASGSAQRWEQPATSCSDALGAVLPAVADAEHADRRSAIVRALVDAANATGRTALPCDAAQRGFERLISSGRGSGRSKSAILSQGEIVLQYVPHSVFEGMHAFMSRRRAASVEERANNNAPAARVYLAGMPMLDRDDFSREPGSSAATARVCLVYVVMFFATVDVWLAECHRLFRVHETRSLVFPEHVPDGYLATMFEAWEQLEFLHSAGRGSEDYMLPYVGKERHEETEPFTRSSQCGTRAGCPNAIHIQCTVGRGGGRRVISPLGPVRRVERMLAALPLDCPSALDMAETLMLGFIAGSGVPALNNGPTGNKRGMLDARGKLDATADLLLRERIREWGVAGCSTRQVDDEPSYWLRRLLAPWAHKWRAGLHLGAPPTLISRESAQRGSSLSAGACDGGDTDISAALTLLVPTAPRGPPSAAPVPAPISTRYVVIESITLPSGPQHWQQEPSYLQVMESWRNPDPDGAASYEFCLWCNACNCPASCCCVCKHLLTGRIDYIREGNSAAWSDALLAPITHGRERTLYGTGRGGESDLATAITSVAGDGSASDSDSDSDDDENGDLRLPRGIVCLPTGMQPPCFADMLTPKPPARPPPQIDVEAALAGIIADCDALRTFASDMLIRRQTHELALTPTQVRAIETASIAQRRERNRLNVLVSALSDQPQANASAPLLGRGNTLRPLRNAAEGAKLAARMHPLGSAMYIPAAGGVTAAASAAPPSLSRTLASAAAGGAAVPAAAQAVPDAALPASAIPAAAIPAAAVPAAAFPAAAAATPVTWPPATASKSAASTSALTQGKATSRGPAGSSQTTASSATDASLSRLLCGNSFPEEVVRDGLPGRSASASNRRLHPASVTEDCGSDADTRTGAEPRKRRREVASARSPTEAEVDRWFSIPRSPHLGHRQTVRLPRGPKTLAQQYDGKHRCVCCGHDGWGPASGFDPTFFMQCTATTCGDVAAGLLDVDVD